MSATDGDLGQRRRIVLSVVSVAALLLGWHAYATIGNTLFAPPAAVAAALVGRTLAEPTIPRAIGAALGNAVLGYAAAVTVGVPAGFALGLSDRLGRAYDPIVDALYAAPAVALAPLFVLWFGLAGTAKALLVFVFAVFVIVIETEAGVADTPDGAVDAARVFGAGPVRVYGEVYLRSALPSVFTGLRLGAGRAVRGMVAAELFLYADELGALLIDSAATFRIAEFLAVVVALSLTGVAAMAAVSLAERAVVRP